MSDIIVPPIQPIGVNTVDYSPTVYNYVVSYFMSRGFTLAESSNMISSVVSLATSSNISIQQVLEQNTDLNGLTLSTNFYLTLNQTNDLGVQYNNLSSALNRNSLQTRSILA